MSYDIEDYYTPLNEKPMKNFDNYPPGYDKRIDDNDDELDEMFDDDGNYIGPDANNEDARLDDQD